MLARREFVSATTPAVSAASRREPLPWEVKFFGIVVFGWAAFALAWLAFFAAAFFGAVPPDWWRDLVRWLAARSDVAPVMRGDFLAFASLGISIFLLLGIEDPDQGDGCDAFPDAG